MAVLHYTCPHCGLPTTLTDERRSIEWHELLIPNADGPQHLRSVFQVCPNPDCRKFTLQVILTKILAFNSDNKAVLNPKPTRVWNLIPPSNAKSFPDYVPRPIRDDYEEACLIVDASPKAAATLARRALQGMIRDFWGIREKRLFDEIEALRDKVDGDTWKAIDGLREIGNVGAHMEKDVNVVVDVEPDEAAQLIWLIELLMKDWYIARYERQMRLNEVAKMAEAKKAARSPSAAQEPATVETS